MEACVSLLFLLAGFVACVLGYVLWRFERVAAGYMAKILSSGLFVSRRDADRILNEELDSQRFPLFRTVAVEVDAPRQRVIARGCGFIRKTAVFRPGLGSTLLMGSLELGNRSAEVQRPWVSERCARIWPDGERVTGETPADIDAGALERVLDKAFEEPNPAKPRRTRAVVVVHNGRIIGERYGPGVTHETPLPGWSMAKSVVGALIGICIAQGKLGLYDRELLAEWRSPDPRADITVDQLLRMRSGLVFPENYKNPLRGVLPMLFDTRSASDYAARSPLRGTPGTQWAYSSGTTNILCRVLRNAVGDAGYLDFPRSALFDKIGMSTAVIEPDASGTFVGSSFMYASARDWARFGLLYLLDGVWNGERILPEGWVEYSAKPASADTKRIYGAHFWLRLPAMQQTAVPGLPPLPDDLFHARGYDEQYLVVIPSRKLVIVRLGLTPQSSRWDQQCLVAGILGAIASHSRGQ